MKKKRYLSLLLAAPLTLLAGCSSTPEISLEPNWFSRTGTESISSSFEETLEYAISFEKSSSALDADFSMDYANGTYKTKLVGSTANNKNTYVYTTELKVDAIYTLRGESVTHTDTLTTRVEFYSVADGLRPISSTREAHVTAPHTTPVSAPATLSAGYGVYDYKVEINYDDELKTAAYTYTDLSKDETSETNIKLKGKGSFFDNEQLLLMLRAAELSSSMTFRTIDFTDRAVTKMSVKDGPTDTTLKQTVKYAGDEEAVERDYKVYEISVAYGKANAGSTRKLTYAQRTNRDSNTHRNVMLKCEYPVIHSHGTILFRLTEANFG